MKSKITDLECQLKSTKQRYADTLRNLGHLNHSLHRQRRANSLTPTPHPSSDQPGGSDSESVQSWQLTENGVQFTGSTGSLPSIGSSTSEYNTIVDEKPYHPSIEAVNMTTTPVINVIEEEATPSLTELAHEIVKLTIETALVRFRHEHQL